jgi:hypothetical protein
LTALCPAGGPSSPKPGVSEFIVFTGSALGTKIGNAGGVWAILLAGLIGVLTYDTANACVTDPPGYSTLTDAEVQALVNADLFSTAGISGLGKVKNNILTTLWYEFCQCNTPPTPAQPAFPSPPANTQIVTQVPNQVACDTHNGIFTATPVVGGFQTQDLINQSSGGAAPLTLGFLLPAGATQVRMTMVNHISGGVPDSFKFGLTFVTANNSGPTTFTQESGRIVPANVASGSTSVFVGNIPANSVGYAAWVTFVSAPNVTNHPEITVEVFCGGSPGQTIAPCCPPDATMIARLDHILGQVELIQRQLVPFAYLTGTSHPGLTGNGQFAVQGILGLKVSLTTVPSTVSTLNGDPLELFGAGEVAWGTADGFTERRQIRSNPFLAFPVDMSAATLVGYSFTPGVVATITELVREP